MARDQRYYLVAFLAPGSIEAEVAREQARLFAEHGLASAQALPPFIPVCFLPPARAAAGAAPEGPAAAGAATESAGSERAAGPEGSWSRLLARVSRSAPGPCSFRATEPLWQDGFLYLAVDSMGAWGAARQTAGAQETGPFPCFEGFYLGCGEASAEQRQSITARAPELRFTSCTVALIRIDCLEDRESWWRELYWEIVAERPLRVRRQG